MRRAALLLVPVLAAAAASTASAHGGGYATPPNGGLGGPQAAPGIGEPPSGAARTAAETKWEAWWIANREDVLEVARRVDASKTAATTPSAGRRAAKPDPAKLRRNMAEHVKESVLPALIAGLGDDTNFDVRCSCAIAIGKVGDQRHGPLLEKVAERDPRPDVRRAALLGLGLLGRLEELPYLSGIVSDKDHDADERATAALAIGVLGGDEAAQFLAFVADRSARRAGAERPDMNFLGTIYCALGATGSNDALPALRRAADDDGLEPCLRSHALLSLGRLGDRDAIPRLAQLVGENHDLQVRRSASAALAPLVGAGDEVALAALATSVRTDLDAVVRRHDVAALGRSRAPSARALLRKMLEAGDVESPLVAIALALSGDATSAPLVREALKAAADDGMRSAYCTALGLFGDADGVPILEQCLAPTTPPGLSRGYAAMALAVLPSETSREAIWNRVVPSADPRIRFDCCIAASLLGEPRVAPYLLDELKNGDTAFVRCGAAACLGLLHRDEAIPDLVALLSNARTDGVVRALCAVALGRIADPSLVPKLSRLSSGSDATLATKALAEALTIL